MRNKLVGFLFLGFTYHAECQNIGININNPQAKLHVVGTSSTTLPLLQLRDQLVNSGTRHIMWRHAAYTNLWDAKASNDANPSQSFFRLNFGGLNKMTLQGDGRIGLGTASPSAGLHINSSNSFLGVVNSRASNMYITLAENGLGNGYLGSFLGDAEDIDFGTFSGNNSAAIHFYTTDTSRMHIGSSGNVGIGFLNSDVQVGVRDGLQVDALSQNGVSGNVSWLKFGSNSGEGIASNYNPSASNFRGLDFYTNFISRMSINSNGYLGIGTTNPQSELDVRGTIRASAFNGIKQIKSGVVTVGSSATDRLDFVLNFSSPISLPANRFALPLLVTVQQTASNVNDSFVTKILAISSTQATVRIERVGEGANGTGWGQPLNLHWMVINL